MSFSLILVLIFNQNSSLVMRQVAVSRCVQHMVHRVRCILYHFRYTLYAICSVPHGLCCMLYAICASSSVQLLVLCLNCYLRCKILKLASRTLSSSPRKERNDDSTQGESE